MNETDLFYARLSGFSIDINQTAGQLAQPVIEFLALAIQSLPVE